MAAVRNRAAASIEPIPNCRHLDSLAALDLPWPCTGCIIGPRRAKLRAEIPVCLTSYRLPSKGDDRWPLKSKLQRWPKPSIRPLKWWATDSDRQRPTSPRQLRNSKHRYRNRHPVQPLEPPRRPPLQNNDILSRTSFLHRDRLRSVRITLRALLWAAIPSGRTELLLVLAKVPRSAWRALYARIERIALSIGWGRILLRHALVGTPARTDKKSGGE